MDAFFALADAHAHDSQRDLAFSARPDAPVLAYVAPRRRMRRLVAWVGASPTAARHALQPRSRRQQPVRGRIVGCRE
jgi:hypothetical protein